MSFTICLSTSFSYFFYYYDNFYIDAINFDVFIFYFEVLLAKYIQIADLSLFGNPYLELLSILFSSTYLLIFIINIQFF